MKYALWIALAAVGAFAADVTGTWTGNIIPDGEGKDTAHLVLKQDGTKVTGTFIASTRSKSSSPAFARGPIPKIPFSLWK